MRVIVWGLGYVGTVSAACLAQLGHEVVAIEPQQSKVDMLKEGRAPVYEPGLSDLVSDAVRGGRLHATTQGASYVPESDVSLICVGTPSAADGSPVLKYVRHVGEDIGRAMRDTDRYHTVALRSTVFPGTTRSLLKGVLEATSGRLAGEDFGLAMNPEFLREANAVSDFASPPYTVIGELDEQSGDVLAALYDGVEAPIRRVSLEEAELVKLANNAFHALKIGFANEIGRLCDAAKIDSHVLMDLVCADTKLNISEAYLRPGFAFGGSCLPKDLRSISHHGRRQGLMLPILDSILPSNAYQVAEARKKVHEVGARSVGVLGLSFKPGTDDLRESPVIDLIRELWQDGIDVIVYDPDVHPADTLGSNRAYLERQLPQIEDILVDELESVLERAGTVVVTQDRAEFRSALKDRPETSVIDLVRVNGIDESRAKSGRYIGLSW